MPKKSISSLELAALINELQFLIKGKISQIYQQDKKEMLLQLHASGKGKKLLRIISGKFLCLTREKEETPLKPTGFCMQLRKYLNNAVIRDLYQKDSERIIIFELEKKDNFFLIIELFSKGNVILTDDKYIIIGSLERQIWKDRVIKPQEKYVFPSGEINWKKITEKELSAILKKSEKKNVVISLATEVGLGGLYAEEICKKTSLDKNKLPVEISADEVRLLLKEIKNLIRLIEKPQGFIYEEEVTPFPLAGEKEHKRTSTYNEAISTLNQFEKNSPYEQKNRTIQKMIDTQEEAVKSLQEKIELNRLKGELIYEKYAPLQKLLDIVKEIRKSKDWSEIAKELKKEKKIKKVDLKKKTIEIEL